ncbi:immunoglobulin kappa light chain-like isoform X2 [Trachemys scripta elegans]|uniref:immunoglobulin kappa light chain-like isoform X2 n=1 Tax=Trachemys scripta elegans TaxID=31138 RepID=UPI0015518BD4|nr:immunoglobulin kappa light chain-like isoform X2 [Trachemys scripta elegans]
MLFAKYLLLSFLVVQVQGYLHQFQPFLFVNINDTAKIQCSSEKQFLAGGMTAQWYRTREGEAPMLIKRCSDNQNVSKVACISEGHNLTLAIYNAQRNDSGVYYCTDSYIIFLTFGNGSTLIVGDSYTTSSWVLPLAPSPHSLLSPGTADLACVVHGVSNPVQISWSISGDLQEQGLTRSLRAKDGSLVFINHISVPVATWTSGKNLTCDVKFNSSGKSVKKIARYMEASSTAPDSECSHYIVPLVAGAGLLLLVVSLSLVWTLCPSTLGFKPRISAPPASEEHQGGILYAHLDFDSRNRNGRTMQRSARGKHLKP